MRFRQLRRYSKIKCTARLWPTFYPYSSQCLAIIPVEIDKPSQDKPLRMMNSMFRE